MAEEPILIKNPLVLFPEGAKRMDILIHEGRFAIGREKDKSGEVINGENYLLSPSFANTHTHAYMSIFRGYGEDMNLMEWLTKKIWPAEAKLKKDHIYWATLLSCIEMAKTGISLFNDMIIFGVPEAKKAIEEIGMKANIQQGLFDLVPGHKTEEEIRKARESITHASKNVKIGIGPHATYTCSEELLKESKELAKENNLLYHIHVSETRKEVFDILKEKGKRPVEYLDSLGILDEKTILAHAGWCTVREISIVGKRRASISHNPVSNLKLGTGGLAQIIEFSQQGANVSLGTDGMASNNSYNFFETMKLAALLQKNFYWKSDVITAKDVFTYATKNGYSALGFKGGEIRDGLPADFFLLDLRSPNLRPLHDPVANIVYSAYPGNLDYLFVNGKKIVENGRVVNVDEQKVIERVDSLLSDVVGG